jgi:hypothetical protein
MFTKLKPALIAATLCAAAAMSNAAIVAVLEITPSSDNANLSISEYRHLTDELRSRAREALPPGYSILTRDNIIQLLPPDEKEAECLAEGCAVDIGRAIGAEYVTQGFVGTFEGMLTLTVELYESMSGNMLGSFVTESGTASGLLGTIREKAPAIFSKIAPVAKLSDSQQASIPANIPSEPKKGGGSFWVAVGLDVLGAAAIGLGVYNNAKASGYKQDAEKIISGATYAGYAAGKSEFDDKNKQAESAAWARNIFYATGGALLLGGVAVHIWF